MMLRHDLGHLNCPYFQESLDNGAELIFIPRDSKMTSLTLYIGQGAYQLDEKIPFGCAYYLMNMIASPSFDQELKKDGIYLETHLDYSYTTFTLSTLGDIYVGLEKLLKRISRVCYEEKDIAAFREKEKKKNKIYFSDPMITSQRGCALELYYESPIRLGVIPNDEKASAIHLSALKRFQEQYYTSKNIVLFLSGKGDARKVIAKLKEYKLPTAGNNIERKSEYQEVYLSVRKDYDTVDTESDIAYLSYGIKMPPRATLYNSFGQMTFYVYETIEKLLFTRNSAFQEKMNKAGAHLVQTKIVQAGEDAYIMLTLTCENHHALITALTEYCSKLDKNINHSEYTSIFQEYFADSIKLLAQPSSLVKKFAYDYPNHVPTTELIANSYKMSINEYKKVVELMNAYPKSVCFARKGVQHA